MGSQAAGQIADLSPDARLQHTDAWLTTPHDGAIIMMHAETGRFISLNETGSRIWGLLETPLTLGELGARMAEEFQVTPEQAIADMKPLALDLLRNGALSLAPAD